MIELLENRFESLKEGFESLENILATGKWIRIAQRGIRIAKTFFTTKNFSGNKDSNRLTQKCMNAPENARKCSTNTQFHSSYEHTTQKI